MEAIAIAIAYDKIWLFIIIKIISVTVKKILEIYTSVHTISTTTHAYQLQFINFHLWPNLLEYVLLN